MVARYDDWPMRLSDYLTARLTMPFEWGVNDCMVHLAMAVEAITGENFMADFPSYDTPEDASALLTTYGGVRGVIESCLGEPSTEILSGMRGDVVLVAMPELTGGIIDDTGERVAVVSEKGLVRVPLDKAVYVWRV